MKMMFKAKTAAVFLACMTLYCPTVFALGVDAARTDSRDTAVFINGEMVAGGSNYTDDGIWLIETGYDYVIENDTMYVPPELIQNELNITVAPASTSYPIIQRNGLPYVALRPVAEDLGMTVNYTEEMTGPYEYFYDTQMPISPADTIVRGRPNVIIDKPYDGPLISKEEAMEKTKALCLEALDNFRKGLLVEAPGLADDCDGIEKAINRMLYIGEVSCFYKYTIGPYDVFYNKYSGEVFFMIYSSNTLIKEVDVNDEGLYSPVFIVG